MSMPESLQFESYKKKLQGVCDEHNLVYRFRGDQYPITLTIQPTAGMYQQMSMLENVEETGFIHPDAKIVFAIKDGVLQYQVSETFTIDEALFNRLKNLFTHMHTLWLQFFFREIIENKLLSDQSLPKIKAEDLEEFEDDEYAADEDVPYPSDGDIGSAPPEVDEESDAIADGYEYEWDEDDAVAEG